jgi:hypothetical protein
MYAGHKPANYFVESMTFRYEKISCPGDINKIDKGIDQKFEGIHLTR